LLSQRPDCVRVTRATQQKCQTLADPDIFVREATRQLSRSRGSYLRNGLGNAALRLRVLREDRVDKPLYQKRNCHGTLRRGEIVSLSGDCVTGTLIR
jgi:hypothetical protein